MLFLFKSKDIHLDCFTDSQYVHDFYKIDNTYKFFPEWWKNLPKSYPSVGNLYPQPTMKTCAGFNSFFTHGITIPLWSDMAVAVDPSGYRWQFSDGFTKAEPHDQQQMAGYLDPAEYGHLKVTTPWLFSCKENVDWAWTQNTWAFSDPSSIIIPPAVVNYKYNMTTSVNVFLNLKQQNNFIIKNGTPLVNIMPLSERKVKLHIHKLSKEEYKEKRDRIVATSFLNKYRNNQRLINKEDTVKKCPFNFKG
jgi:hypothetical protein